MADWGVEEATLAAAFDQYTVQRWAGNSLHNRRIASVVVQVAVGLLRDLRRPSLEWRKVNREEPSSDERIRPGSQE